jgi:hypothetical protein
MGARNHVGARKPPTREQVRQGNVRPEPFDQNVATIATGPAARALDAHRIVRELIERH